MRVLLLRYTPLNFAVEERLCELRSCPGDYRVPERKPTGDDEPDALHHERMLTSGGDGFDYLAGFRISEGERDDCRRGKDRRPENFLDFRLAGLLVAREDEVALSYPFDRLEGDFRLGIEAERAIL